MQCRISQPLAVVLLSSSLTFAVGAPAAAVEVSIVQQNVQFLTPTFWPGGKIAGHLPNKRWRAEAIGKRLACFDVVALNETIHDDRRKDIVRAMEQEAPRCGKRPRFRRRHFAFEAGPSIPGGLRFPFGKGLRRLVDDEVMVLSRYPIIQRKQHIFKHASGVDKHAAKGVLFLRLDTPGRPLSVFATHLQNGDRRVRAGQIGEMIQFIKNSRQKGDLMVVLGDFNINGSARFQADRRSEYSYLARQMAGVMLADIGTKGLATDSDGKQRIDYIFASPFLKPRPAKTFWLRQGRKRLSDHAAISTVIRIPKRKPKLLPPLSATRRLSINIDRLEALSKDSCNKAMDFFGWISFYDRRGKDNTRRFRVKQGNDIGPNWRHEVRIAPNTSSAVARIFIRDDDDAACGGSDDTVDIHPSTDQKQLNFHIDLRDGAVRLMDGKRKHRSPKVQGRIGRPITLAGTRGKEVGRITFTVNLSKTR